MTRELTEFNFNQVIFSILWWNRWIGQFCAPSLCYKSCRCRNESKNTHTDNLFSGFWTIRETHVEATMIKKTAVGSFEAKASSTHSRSFARPNLIGYLKTSWIICSKSTTMFNEISRFLNPRYFSSSISLSFRNCLVNFQTVQESFSLSVTKILARFASLNIHLKTIYSSC